MDTPNSRRIFLRRAAAGALALPILGMTASAQAQAQALKKLTPDLPQAKALSYVPDGATAKAPTFKPGSACSNCQFYTAATGACALFVGYAVAPKGWCTAWAKKG
jgi:High potential iron-sulfur protein